MNLKCYLDAQDRRMRIWQRALLAGLWRAFIEAEIQRRKNERIIKVRASQGGGTAMRSPRRSKAEAPAIDVDVLKPVPVIDAAYLRNASHIVEVCVIESLQAVVLDELVKAARSGAYEAALNVTGLCDRFEQPVCQVSAAKSIVRFLQGRGIAAQCGKGRTKRLGWEDEIIIVEAAWREVAR